MQPAEKPSLYDRLGGIYNIATVVDEFIDRVMTDPRLNANPLVDEAHHRHTSGYCHRLGAHTESGIKQSGQAASKERSLGTGSICFGCANREASPLFAAAQLTLTRTR